MCSKETLCFCSAIEKGSAVKRLALISIIASSNVYSQDFYFDNDFYHEIDCSVEEACYISSYENGLVWDSKVNMDEIRRTTDLGRVYYKGKYRGSSFKVTIKFYPKEKELYILKGRNAEITYRCQLTDKKQYICKDRVNGQFISFLPRSSLPIYPNGLSKRDYPQQVRSKTFRPTIKPPWESYTK